PRVPGLPRARPQRHHPDRRGAAAARQGGGCCGARVARREHPRPALGRVSAMSQTPETEISESDPNADSAEGLAGGMGVSSERKGHVRGQAEEVTYAAAPTHLDEPPEGET